MQPNFDSSIDYAQLLQLAQSPAGQQLIAALKQSQGNQLSAALTKAALGDYAPVKTIVTEFLSTAEGKALLEQFGRQT